MSSAAEITRPASKASPREGAVTVIRLSVSVREKAFNAAARRDLKYTQLLEQIITTVFDEGLLGAVLDEGRDSQP